MNKNIVLKLFGAVTFLMLAYVSCHIGLGESVDVEAPTGTITSPGVEVTIRDSFAIQGTWKDDGTVKQVIVKLRNLSTSEEIVCNDVTVNADGTWICKVENSSEDVDRKVKDGSYEATVTLVDDGGHKGSITRSYTIDNTPPVVLLSYLKASDDTETEIKTYGKKLSLSGKAADAKNIEKLDIKYYEKEECSEDDYILTVTKKNVSGAIDLIVASYGDDLDEDEWNDYKHIYGSKTDDLGTVIKYCKIFAYDSAQRYPIDGSEQTEDDKLGNCQTEYYFQDEIDKLGLEININDLYAILSGTYDSGSERTADSPSITPEDIEELEKAKVSVGTFELNPKNSPTFTVIGLNGVLLKGEEKSMADDDSFVVTNGDVNNGIALQISITRGLDNYPIATDTVIAYLAECDEYGDLIFDAKKIDLVDTSSTKKTTIKTKPISKANYETLDTGNYYRVIVEGKDENGNDIVASYSGDKEQIYAFYLESSGLAPTLKPKFYTVSGKNKVDTAGGTVYVGDNKTITIYGIYYDSDTGVKPLDFKIDRDSLTDIEVTYSTGKVSGSETYVTVDDFSANNCKTLEYKTYSTFDGSGTTAQIRFWKAVFTPVLEEEISKEITVQGANSTARTAWTNVFGVVKDTEAPVISRENVKFTDYNSNVVYMKGAKGSGEKYYLNNIKTYKDANSNTKTISYNLNGIATDNIGLDSVKLTAVVNGTPVDVPYTDIGTVSTWKFTNIDLSSFTSTDKITLYVTLVDLAGNENTDENSKFEVVFDTTAPVGKHQSDVKGKDIYFRIGDYKNDEADLPTGMSWDDEIDLDVGGKYHPNTYSNKQLLKIRGLFDDGDIFDSTKDVSGVKKIYYRVFSKDEYDSDEIKITIGEDKYNPMENLVGKDKDLIAQINEQFLEAQFADIIKNAPSDNTIDPLSEVEEKRVFYNTITGKAYESIKSNFKQELKGFGDGNNYLVMVAQDNVGNYALDCVELDEEYFDAIYNNFSLNVDCKAPVVDCEQSDTQLYSNGSSTTAGKTKDGNIVLEGTVIEALSDGAKGEPSTLKTLKIRVGTETTTKEVLFELNNDDRKLVITKGGVKGSEITLPKDIVDTDVDMITYSKTDEHHSETVHHDWKVTLPGSYFAGKSGNVVIQAIAVDYAENESSSTIVNVTVDTKAPDITLNKPSNLIKINNVQTINGTVSMNGTISEDFLTKDEEGSGTLELYYTIKSGLVDGGTVSAETFDGGENVNAASKWRKYKAIEHADSFTFNDIDTSKLILSGTSSSTNYIPDQTKVFFTVKATDLAGNIGFAKIIALTVDQDSDRPEITFKNLTLATNEGTKTAPDWKSMTFAKPVWVKSNQLWGTVEDDDGVNEVYVIEKHKNADGTEADAPSDGEWSAKTPEDNIYDGTTWACVIADDGFGTLYFKVVDKAGKSFISKNGLTTLDINTPKITDGTNKYGYREGSGATETTNILNSTVYVQVDTSKPLVNHIYYTTDSDSAAAITPSNIGSLSMDSAPAGWDGISSLSGYIGGSTDKLWVLYDSSDANGILSASEKIVKDETSVTATEKVTSGFTTDETLCKRLVEFDVSGLTSGANRFELSVTDRSGNESEAKEYTVNIDNNAPLIEDIKRDDGETVYGSLAVDFKGKARDEQKQTVTNVLFAVTKDTTAPAAAKYTDIAKYISVSGGNWDISFDGKLDENDESKADTATTYHAKLLNDYLDEIYGEGTSSSDVSKEVYVWVYAVDSLGNSGFAKDKIEKTLLKVLPQADKPTVTIDYPTDAVTVGGTIRITGTTVINADKVAGVYFQIDPNYNGSTFSSTWEADLTALVDAYNEGKEDSAKVSYSIIDVAGIGKAIKQTSGTVMNWTFAINTKGEFTKISETQNRRVAVKAYAISDKNSRVSDPVTVNFYVDPDRPQFGSDLILESIDGKKSMKYVENMWLSGEWYLKGSVSHSSGIKTLEIREPEGDSVVLTHNTDRTEFSVKVGKTSGTGKSIFNIYAESGTDKDYDITIKLQYDNIAPTSFAPGTATITSLAATGNKFVQNNGTFQLKGTITDGENASGLKRIAFYFTRTVDDTEYFIDPMITKESSVPGAVAPARYRNNYIPTAGLTSEDGLLWRKVENANVANTNELTVSSVPDNVRVGSICKLNNVVYRIKAIEGTTITLDGSLTDATNLDVYFALAQIIDNTSVETGTTDVYKDTDDMTNQDGDCMQEGIQDVGSIYSWQASINSKNIYDGPVILHFVYYDAAGNCAASTYEGQFCNNPPRIASVTVATDYDGDGEPGKLDSEKDTYYVTGSQVTNLINAVANLASKEEVTVEGTTAGTSFWTLKGNSKFDVEIIGGNGKLWYSYNIGTTAGAEGNIKGDNDTSDIGDGNQDNDGRDGVSSTPVTYDSSTHIKSISVSESDFDNYLGKGTGEGSANTCYIPNSTKTAPTWFTYTIWDETDGLEKFNTSQKVTMKLALEVQVHDEQNPSSVISPFKWVSETDNSLYGSSKSNGHIELESDWIETSKYKAQTGTAKTSGEYDADPKVSGKIVFRGSVWDNILIKDLWAKISWGSGTSAKSFAFTNSLSGTAPTDIANYKKVAVYEKKGGTGADKNNMVWKLPDATIAADGWTFSIDTNTDGTYKGNLDATGHTVYWTLELDTEKLDASDICANDVTVSVMAVDSKSSLISPAASSGSSSSDADKDNNVPSYRMDVVPYITDISSGDLDSGTRQYLRRSASGAFVANIDDESNALTVKGFNLKGGKIYLDTTAKTTTASGSNLTVAKGLLDKSGNIKVINNSIETLNNLNRDSASYNKEASQFAPNHIDDRYIYIWDTTTTSYSGSEAVMKPVINTSGAKTGDMMWMYADNNQYLRANGTRLTQSWAGAIYGGDFAYNSKGSPSWTFLHNMNWSSGSTAYTNYGSVQWGKKFTDAGRAYYWNETYEDRPSGRLGLGNLSFASNTQSYSYIKAVMKRYENIKMQVTGNNTDTLNMVAYFDKADESRSIVFWRFHEGSGISKKNEQTGANSYSDLKRYVERTTEYDTSTTDGTRVGLDTPAGREEITTAQSKADSQYFDMAYDSVKNVVYIAYYDESAGGLKIKYLNNPAAGYYGSWTNSWSDAVDVDLDAAGQYVSMKTDGSGKIHLAYYDSTGSYLKYALIEPTGTSGNISALTVSKKVLVDTMFTNGMYNSITLRQFGTNDVRPVICSYSMSYGGTKYSLRTSWPRTTVADIEAGATSDSKYTGKWETLVVVAANPPTQNNTFVETNGTGYTGNIVVGYNASKLEQAELKF